MPAAPYQHIDGTTCTYARAAILRCTYDMHFQDEEGPFLQRTDKQIEPGTDEVKDAVLNTTPAVVYQYTESKSSVEIEDMTKGAPKITVKVYEGTTDAQLGTTAKQAYDTWKALRDQVNG